MLFSTLAERIAQCAYGVLFPNNYKPSSLQLYFVHLVSPGHKTMYVCMRVHNSYSMNRSGIHMKPVRGQPLLGFHTAIGVYIVHAYSCAALGSKYLWMKLLVKDLLTHENCDSRENLILNGTSCRTSDTSKSDVVEAHATALN